MFVMKLDYKILPVLAAPMQVLPSNILGMQFACIGVGTLRPVGGITIKNNRKTVGWTYLCLGTVL